MSKILIADDEQKIRKLVCDFLKNVGYDTLEAEDGDDRGEPPVDTPVLAELRGRGGLRCGFRQYTDTHRQRQQRGSHTYDQFLHNLFYAPSVL